MSAALSPRQPSDTVFQAGAARLGRLSRALGVGHREPSVVDLFSRILRPWGHRALGDGTPWPSYVGDDHTPVEFSITLEASPELRVLAEPLGQPASLASNRDAALSLVESL